MKILLDEMISPRFRRNLVGPDAFTVYFMGWKGRKNGSLFGLMSGDGFNVLVTTDRKMEYQLNPAHVTAPVVVLHARKSGLDYLRPFVPELLALLARPLTPGFYNLHPAP